MRVNNLIGTLLGATLLVGVFATPTTTIAQNQEIRNQIIPVVELDQADVRDALKIIFKAVNASYTVSNDVQGTVTVHLRDVPFETALRNVLNQVEATYRVEGNVYVIIPKPTTVINPGSTTGTETPTTNSKSVIRIKIRKVDPQLLTLILAGSADINTSPEMSTMSGLGGGGGGFGGGSGGGFGGGGFGGGSGGGFGGGGFGGGSGGGFGGGGFGGGSGGGFGGGGFGGGGFGGGGGGFGGGR